MQKVFDVDNKEDMDLLWSILPDDVVRISPMLNKKVTYLEKKDDEEHTEIFKINWHDKTEITRPVNYDDMIGCVGWFWDKEKKYLGILWEIIDDKDFPYMSDGQIYYKHFEPAKKSELKFYEDK